MNLVEQIIRDSLPSPDRRSTAAWAGGDEDHEAAIDFGNLYAYKGPYDVENTPWTLGILQAMDNPRVRMCTSVMPPQESGKTLAAQVCIAERVVRRPASQQFNTVTNVKARTFADTKWRQTKQSVKAIQEKLTDNRHDETKTRIIFKDATFLMIQGIETDANRQSDSVEQQINDECQLWLTPWLEETHKRTLSYQDTRKILNLGLGGLKGSEWETAFLNGNQGEWSHHCPACDKLFQYRFNLRDPKGSNVHFDKTKLGKTASGDLDCTEFDKTVHVTCLHCEHKMYYDKLRLRKMNLDAMRRGDGYVYMNPGANPENVSLHVNAFAIGMRPWAEIIRPFIRATSGRSVFNTETLKSFICSDLAEFWEEKQTIVRKLVAMGDFTRREMKDPKFWQDEWIRLMSIDNQHGGMNDVPHRWFVCRAFARDGRSRLVDCGRINEWADVRAKQLELGVPDPTPERPGPWVVCDRQHDPAKVDEVCARYKWHGIMGQDTDRFRHEKGTQFAPEEAQDLYFSDERSIDTGYGTAEQGRMVAYYILYSKQRIEEILAALRNGTAEPWEAPKDLLEFAPFYIEHINSHHQVLESTKNGEKLMWRGISGAADHILDCETELTVLALMAGVYKRN